QSSMEAMLAQARSQHAADRIYVSLLAPETQAGLSGETLTSLPLSMANALGTLKAGQEATLNGETAIMAADAPAGGTLNGFQVLTLLVEAGGGVH
ncbi:MAG TPA: SpoIVB peptidase S55, partial [Terracidiphilus sp.]